MARELDLVMRNGSIVDGTGYAPRDGEVAIEEGRIVAVGKMAGSGAEEIDAKGRIVTPGFVDIHTHYDAQAVWDSRLILSSWHT
jgi:N-acyl-D-amino-acid deacylase